MPRATFVPITASVLTWAVRESGYSSDEVAGKLGIPSAEFEAWQHGKRKPTLTQFRRLATILKRTPATFLLPAPPETTPITVQFRHPPDSARSSPSPVERRYLREAARLQDAAKWVMHQLGEPPPALPAYAVNGNTEQVAQHGRQRITALLPSDLTAWHSTSQAFDAWRTALERSGVLVFLFPLGKDSARGFSLWDDDAPLIAVNTWWNDAARIFTLFHEYGHLLTRTSSVCLEWRRTRLSKPSDRAERWCEEYAAALLLPWGPVMELLRRRFGWRLGRAVDDLEVPKAVAGAFKVSWRAATIRLIERGVATWDLYTKIPPIADHKGGGGGGRGRDRDEAHRDQYGGRTIDLFVRALDHQVLGRSDVLDYLDVTDSGLDRLQSTAAQPQ